MFLRLLQGQFPESHDQFAGIYWAVLSSEATQEVVESSDAIVFVGPLVNDYNTAGYSHNLPPSEFQPCLCLNDFWATWPASSQAQTR